MAGVSSYISVGIREELTDKLIRTGDGEAMFLSNLQKRSIVPAHNSKHIC